MKGSTLTDSENVIAPCAKVPSARNKTKEIRRDEIGRRRLIDRRRFENAGDVKERK